MKPTEPFFITKTKWYCKKDAEKWLIICADLLAFLGSFYLSAFLVNQFYDLGSGAPWVTVQQSAERTIGLVLAIILIGAFWAKGHYTRRRPYSNEVQETLVIIALLALFNIALVFFTRVELSRTLLVMAWLLVPCLILANRALLKNLLIRLGGWKRPMVIIGYGENALQTARAFDDESMMGYTLTAFLVPDDRERVLGPYTDCHGRLIPCIALGASPETTLAHLGDPHVVLAMEQGGIETYQDIIERIGRRNKSIQIVPSVRGLPLYGMEVDYFFAHEVLLLTVRNNLSRRFPQLVKRCFDLMVSGTALLFLLPLFVWIGARILATGGPIFYGHQRIGKHKQSFPCLKFRTMAPNADQLLADLVARDSGARAEWERDFKLKNDPRITPIGQFLRRSSLDELPQLWNVLKGEMSLVGPRPVVEAELERYGNQVDYYLEANPGITGLWQISGRNDVSYETRVYLDVWYVKNWSLFSDIVILIKTVKVIFKKDGAY